MKNTARGMGTWGVVLVVATVGCGEPPDDPGNDDVTLAQEALGHETHDRHDHARGPRLRAPLSATISTSRRPLLRWFGSHDDSVRVEVCRDRDCDHTIVAFTARGSHARPPRALPAGPVFWRVLRPGRHHDGRAQVWELMIPARDSGRPGSWGAIPDFDGDGFSDLEVTALGVGAPPAPSEVRDLPGGPGGPAATPAQTFAGAEVGFGATSGPVGDSERRRLLRSGRLDRLLRNQHGQRLSRWAERGDGARRVRDARGDARRAGAGRQRR